MTTHRAIRRRAVLVLAAGWALAGCASAAHGAEQAAPPPALTTAQAASVQAAYDTGNNQVNHTYDINGISRIETPPLQLASRAWLRIRQQQRQVIPPSNQNGGTFLVPPAGGYPRWFLSLAVRVRGGVPSARPVYTLFTQQSPG